MKTPRTAGFILLIIVLVFSFGCKKKTPTLKIGDKLPPVTLEEDGREVGLNELMNGKLTIILFWEKGCAYCEREMPYLEPLYEKYRDRGVLLVGVHMGPGQDAVATAVQNNGLSFPMLVDPKAVTRSSFGIVAVPSIFFVGSDGTVNEKILGGLPAEDLERLLIENL